jgi:putative acetyltransferase
MKIRKEAPSDWPEVDGLLRQTFGGDYEAEVVSQLRHDGLIAVAFIAEDEGHVVGHIALSWLPTQVEGRTVPTVALAPIAVRVDRQRVGIGARLIETALDAAKRVGAKAVIVSGDPGYYQRFGFSAELAAKLSSPLSGPAFMALELSPGALSGGNGSVAYPRAFGVKQK